MDTVWLFLDMSSHKNRSLGGSVNWLLVIDDATDNDILQFLKTKDHLSGLMIPFNKGLYACHGMFNTYIAIKLARILFWRRSAKKLALAFSLNTLCQVLLSKWLS